MLENITCFSAEGWTCMTLSVYLYLLLCIDVFDSVRGMKQINNWTLFFAAQYQCMCHSG